MESDETKIKHAPQTLFISSYYLLPKNRGGTLRFCKYVFILQMFFVFLTACTQKHIRHNASDL